MTNPKTTIVFTDLPPSLRTSVADNDSPTEVNIDHLADILKAGTLLTLSKRQREAKDAQTQCNDIAPTPPKA